MSIPTDEIISLFVACALPAFKIALIFGLGTFIIGFFLKMALGKKVKF